MISIITIITMILSYTIIFIFFIFILNINNIMGQNLSNIQLRNGLRNNYCMDITNSSNDDAYVQGWDCNGASNQIFDYNRITNQIMNKNSGKCLGFDTNGQLIQTICIKSNNQSFLIKNNNIMSKYNNNLCIGMDNNEYVNGTKIKMYQCNGDISQTWIPNKIASYSNNNYCMNNDPNDNIIAWNCNDTLEQKIAYNPQTEQLIFAKNNKCLSYDKDNIIKSDICNDSINQKFKLGMLKNNMTIKSNNLCLDLKSLGNGASIMMHNCDGSNGQLWNQK
jgi:hypothetical protein